MLIRDWFFRLYGDVAHDWRFCTVMIVIVLLLCWLSAEGVVSVGHKLEHWADRRAARSRRGVDDAAVHPGRITPDPREP